MEVERLSTGIPEFDKLVTGGIPRGFLVAVTGEPGTGKTIFCIHFIDQGVKEGDVCIYVTTEESRQSILKQAAQFGIDFQAAVKGKRLIIIDALMGLEDQWSLRSLEVEELLDKIIEAKKALGYGRARLVIDSLSAFWLDRPAMARRYSYFVKKVLSKWDFTIMAVSQYAITTSDAFGFGVEHIADGIIRFRRYVRNGVLRRYVIVEKMRQTPHSLTMHEITALDGRGLVILGAARERREDVALPVRVMDKLAKAKAEKEKILPGTEIPEEEQQG
ncbi:TPA: KaiC domain-containing protein [Candidatus Bathyarchaeota archaeon]|nr:KaiC domain-containing protein [Candidatus Bathyarchaeota archaeon]